MMHPSKIFSMAALSGALLLYSCGDLRKTYIDVELAPEYDGDTVSLAEYDDSTVYATAVARNGHAAFVLEKADTLGIEAMSMVMVGGRTKGYFVLDPGANINVSCVEGGATKGTPNNDALYNILAIADSIDATGDTQAYADYMIENYVRFPNSAMAVYFASEASRFSSLATIDSLLKSAPENIKQSKRIARWRAAAALRDKTAPGRRFIDFAAVQPNGSAMRLSDVAGKGKYVLVDFWASWCPWCIKELPALKNLYAQYSSKGLEIVGVAVRDEAIDTRKAIDKHGISWPVMYNTARIPYDIYGFTGIPHLMLLAPDGTIISRGETPEQIEQRLKKLTAQ